MQFQVVKPIVVGLSFFTAIGMISPSVLAQKTLASTLDVYVFPSAGQDVNQQNRDETECFEWASKQSGVDPFETSKQEVAAHEKAQESQQKANEATRGAGARGAIGGAATGALIGEIVDDDASKGAAYGALAGTIMARRSARSTQAQAQQVAEQEIKTARELTAEQKASFNKAFSVCLEAKKYLVKF